MDLRDELVPYRRNISPQFNGQRYRILFECSNDGMVLLAPDGTIQEWNASAGRIFGMIKDEGLNYPLADIIQTLMVERAGASAQHKKFKDTLLSLLEKGESPLQKQVWEYELQLPNGQQKRIQCVLSVLNNAETHSVAAVIRDVSQLEKSTPPPQANPQQFQIQRALLESEDRFRKVFESSAIGMSISKMTGEFMMVNPALCKMTGYTSEEMLAKNFKDITYPDDLRTDLDLVHQMLEGKIPSYQLEKRYLRKNGTTFWGLVNSTLIRSADGKPQYFVRQIEDINERKEVQQRLQFLATHDSLTSLPNRALFNDRLLHAVQRARRDHRQAALLFIDLDGFKQINDNCGHGKGDTLLQLVAERLKTCIRDSDTVARIGGDEFTIILENISSKQLAALVAQKILDTLAVPYQIGQENVQITASIGIGIYPEDGEDSDALLSHADKAMYRAKELGKNDFQYYYQAELVGIPA